QVLERAGQDALGFVAAAERDRLVCQRAEHAERVQAMRGCGARGGLGRARMLALDDQRELLAADTDHVAVRELARAPRADALTVDADAVAAAQIFDRDRIRRHAQAGVMARYQWIVERQLAARAAPD